MNLIRYNKYSRKDLHILSGLPNEFVEGAGVWGLRGIVTVPGTIDDYVFFVSFGHKQGDHQFDEGITEDGVLTWQSQPQQRLHHPQIKRFINHDSRTSNIHLMLRTHKGHEYTYLGVLDYLWHDPDKERPVWFNWQIEDWLNKPELFDQIGLILDENENVLVPDVNSEQELSRNELRELNNKPNKRKKRRETSYVQRKSKIDQIAKAKTSKNIGDAGELLVLAKERQKLIEFGIENEPIHIAKKDDNAGYDILSYDEKGEEIYIEVKTTKGTLQTPFFISANEVAVSNNLSEKYFIYRLYEYDPAKNAAKFYVQRGSLANNYELVPKDFVAIYKGSDEKN
ncbi:DUF3427 domain-containing protein [Psychroserpens sp.]|uniref:DUF3427 domain-containing protein n=1 Tax=Psychroserpens sp. TaxID=2020870 RepID=UPI001B27747D|nr:DUF3427 domain-containing protein [Psychroserpens sp.]MBO6607406.1 DUF3427 domain-containing protein [Psychroserpens sp.]MBO6632462.1 DUF3427 domain-containing protein [Psychroserpens sp.]MBO6654516.1 DUF3427 domain-containing protein [Psychroserpens sp.]MBO6681135.1 DUF3427 domain-containing protein [Psychroserpens sp.]MBO6749908.1 DUF3427 domain-containing protein [Psychroserpens sp.]